MTTTKQHGKRFGSKDVLVKVLATAFLNPMDRDHQGKKIFVQNFLGCGCPDEVVEQAKISFFVRPLGALLERTIVPMEPATTATPLEKEVNVLVNLPKNQRWPRKRSGKIVAPAAWRRHMIDRVAKKNSQAEKLVFLRKMANATIDVAIEVPGRAFFFLVVQETKTLQKARLVVQYESGQMLYNLMGYNRCRLFTITGASQSKIIPQIDTALSWHGLYETFLQARHGYAFADRVLSFFEPVE
jgi:hypothetical protein